MVWTSCIEVLDRAAEMGNAHGSSCCKMNPTSSPCLVMMAFEMTTTPNASLKVGLGYRLTSAEGLDSPCFTTMTRFHVQTCRTPISVTSANLSRTSWSGSRKNSTHPSFYDPQKPILIGDLVDHWLRSHSRTQFTWTTFFLQHRTMCASSYHFHLS